MGSRLYWQMPVRRRKTASRIWRPCTMHTSRRNRRDLGVLSVRTIYSEGAALRQNLLLPFTRVGVEVHRNSPDYPQERNNGHELVKECELWHRCLSVLPANKP